MLLSCNVLKIELGNVESVRATSGRAYIVSHEHLKNRTIIGLSIFLVFLWLCVCHRFTCGCSNIGTAEVYLSACYCPVSDGVLLICSVGTPGFLASAGLFFFSSI
jgi:hypothetical protein